MFLSVTSVGKNSESESLWGIKPHTFGLCILMLYHWTTETLWWARSITKFIWHMSCKLLGSAMSIASIMFVNGIREMVSFELGKEIKMFFIYYEHWKKKNSESPNYFFFVPHSWQTKNIFPHFFKLSSKLTISQILFMPKFVINFVNWGTKTFNQYQLGYLHFWCWGWTFSLLNSGPASLICLAPHFRLLRVCEESQHKGDLEGIDALLGKLQYVWFWNATNCAIQNQIHFFSFDFHSYGRILKQSSIIHYFFNFA